MIAGFTLNLAILTAVVLPGNVDFTPEGSDVLVEATDRHPGGRQTKPHDASSPTDEPFVSISSCRIDAAIPLYGCRDVAPDDPAEGLTEGDILRAVREIGLPSLKVRIQPGTATLVNIPTIFYAQPQPFRRNVTLLGFDIDLIAEPAQYRWLHGDGTTATTHRSGKPYPSTDITYSYRQPAESVRPRVDVTYEVRYRVDGGPWATLSQTLTASGPTADLEVKEAAPVLTTP